MSFTAKLYDDGPAEPVPTRRPTRIAASLRHPLGAAHHVIVHNLSSQGLLIESYHPLAVGADITIEISELGEARAQVVWRQDAFYDCVFATPMDADRVRSKMTSAKVVWGHFGRHHRTAGHASFAMRQLEWLSGEIRLDEHSAIDRWSPRARLACIVGGAALCWVVPVGLIMLYLD